MSWILRRLVQLVVVILVVTFFTALLSSLLPGDPCRTMLPTGRPSDIAQCRHDIGLDENLVVRYGKWAKGFFTGDMGRYYTIPGQQGDSIFDHVKSSLPTSLLIVFYVQLLTLLIAIPLGVLSAYKAGSLYDRGGTGMAFALVVVLIWVFLGSVRSTLIPAVAIPVSIVGAFAILSAFGYSVNMLTMLALVLAAALVALACALPGTASAGV